MPDALGRPAGGPLALTDANDEVNGDFPFGTTCAGGTNDDTVVTSGPLALDRRLLDGTSYVGDVLLKTVKKSSAVEVPF